MDVWKEKKRLEKVFLQLLEVARGNFSTYIERSENTDELEALIALVNIVTEELRNSFLHQGYVNFMDSYAYSVQLLFILDGNFIIWEINKGVTHCLGYDRKEVLGKHFDGLLTKESKKKWKSLTAQVMTEERTVQLTFITQENLIAKLSCSLIPFTDDSLFTGKTLITAFELVKQKTHQVKEKYLLSTPKREGKRYLQISDVEKLRTAGAYIRSHLEEGLPSLRELALILGTNEFKLKKGFKELFGLTVFQFLKSERLRKALVLIEHTEKPIKEISQMVGFKNASHFTREFKKKYHSTPQALRMMARGNKKTNF